MAPKKDKKKEEEANKAAAFTEVEKEFLVLQIADLNRKVTRLRAAVDEYEARNDELQKAYDQLDEDRADIIAYLKKTLVVKTEENNELKEKVRGLEETREIETSQFNERVSELEKDFITMKDLLSSENKLLAGKLNTLEEFRAIRDDLMRKFETQEQQFKDQEEKYKHIIYETEKKFTTDKDKLKKEMEGRLLQLAQDFQDATELRIAASTHRVIRENIAINHELDKILGNQTKIAQLNEKYKDSEKQARIEKELSEEEKQKAIEKSITYLKIIQQLNTALEKAKTKASLYDKSKFDVDVLQVKLQELTHQNEELASRVGTLEENINVMNNERSAILAESTKLMNENDKLKKVLKEAALSVRAALKLDDKTKSDSSSKILERQALLSSLLEIVIQYREVHRTESTESLVSHEKVYKEGDLGFVPKPPKKRSIMSARSPKPLKQQSVQSSERERVRPCSMSSLTLSTKAIQEKTSIAESLPILETSKISESNVAEIQFCLEKKSEGTEIIKIEDTPLKKSDAKPKSVTIVETEAEKGTYVETEKHEFDVKIGDEIKSLVEDVVTTQLIEEKTEHEKKVDTEKSVEPKIKDLKDIEKTETQKYEEEEETKKLSVETSPEILSAKEPSLDDDEQSLVDDVQYQTQPAESKDDFELTEIIEEENISSEDKQSDDM